MTIDAVEFNNWGTNSDSGTENKAAIRTLSPSTRCTIGAACVFKAEQSDSYAIYAHNEYTINTPMLAIEYSSQTIISPDNDRYSYIYKRPGGKITLVNVFTS
ncbi:hypothetical protein HV095_19630 [Escherichia coli]|uniref:hypothetical protein n=1 Tax=Escherichia coli TaxID=562 RepID=UPI0017E22C98|nr:hypothetical protein [Escherichia coli]MBA8019634.1 hypothetical protein [Escherichia coli]MBS8727188.1 hypothetical protein [Escherichia coli]MBS8793499.1 hypothetical protein [Escherichia coli]